MEKQPTSSDLEQFRQQWQQEVSARTQQQAKGSNSNHVRTKSSTDQGHRPERLINKPPGPHPLADKHDEEVIPESSAQAVLTERLGHLDIGDADADEFSKLGRAEPTTALEHYERAVEKEGQGKLGDSLSHYRRAFKLDDSVDQAYKEKHFAHKWKPSKPNPSNAAVTVPSTAHHSQSAEAGKQAVPQTTAQLIASFADCDIENAPPMIEGDAPPPCPIRKLPTEVLLELLDHIARIDISIYARLASVCKKLAYHVYTESSIWKRISLGAEFGLASQQYHFATDIQGRPIIWSAVEDEEEDIDERPMPPVTDALFPANQDWREILHSYPRIRYTGVYISTVNYTRSGGTSATPSTWGSQVHIVTYYRYLRFFRDGTLISLLTTHEPIEVIHLLTKENIALVRSGKTVDPMKFAGAGQTLSQQPNMPPPPSAQNILKHALRGRWRLCHPSLDSAEVASNSIVPGDVHIETEGGAGPRYQYTMHLSLKHGNNRNKFATKNNKLIWKGFWSYNSITHDWAEFQLRNDKAFWFSRVKSYGLGY
ncbi:hypothetical protein PMZ80_000028 [Knufia obscura]|uniref:F-box domain-containing protein n=2 Tax=Knufia TaxID=430999 RepID=A0AAN8E9W9_9EURO|nr:hypothetical protein PMZ80_000028 [Knufia obscura]KAK5948790.1 hypothetical protein OHC33_010214 [Knufia fluminis]